MQLVKLLGLYTIGERSDYFLATLISKSINTRGTDGMNAYLPMFKKDIYKNSFCIKEVNYAIVFQML